MATTIWTPHKPKFDAATRVDTRVTTYPLLDDSAASAPRAPAFVNANDPVSPQTQTESPGAQQMTYVSPPLMNPPNPLPGKNPIIYYPPAGPAP